MLWSSGSEHLPQKVEQISTAFEITVGTRVPLDRDVVAEFADAGVDRLIVTAEGDTIADVETIIEHNAPENLLAGSAGQRNTARVERLGE